MEDFETYILMLFLFNTVLCQPDVNVIVDVSNFNLWKYTFIWTIAKVEIIELAIVG